MRICFFLNPQSRGGKGRLMAKRLEAIHYPEGTQIDFVTTAQPEETSKKAKELAGRYDVLCAVGGDGTINGVARGIFEAKKGILGIIPYGTGNDTVKGLGWTKDFDEAVYRLLHGSHRKIDCGLADRHFFINIASIGFDADAANRTDRIKQYVRGSFAYKLAVAESLIRYRPLKFRTDMGEEEKLFLLAVCNGTTYGGGFRIMPVAKMDDGFFDICLIREIPRLKLLSLLPTLVQGTHIQRKEVQHSHEKGFTVTVLEDFLLNIDGELYFYEGNQTISFEMMEQEITLMA